MNFKISVVTVCYNAVNCIEETILSVINQTYQNVEYLIIDGGSTDGTVDVIKKYLNHITYWVSEPDNGIYDAMNKGIAIAKGEYLNFMNAGDIFYNNEVLSKIFTTNITEDYIVGKTLLKNTRRIWNPAPIDFTFIDICRGGAVNHQASFIKRTLLSDGYDTTAKIISDELLFIDKIVFGAHSYKPLSIIVSIYDTNGISNQKEKKKDIELERINFLKKKLPRRILYDYNNPKVVLKKEIIRLVQSILEKFCWQLHTIWNKLSVIQVSFKKCDIYSPK